MIDFIKDYGVLVVTTLYFFATVWYTWTTRNMANVMRSELRFKTRPVLALFPAQVQANKFETLEIRQVVVNSGVSFLAMDKATLHWSRSIETGARSLTPSATPLPHHLAPGQSLEILFRLTKDAFQGVDQTGFLDAAEVISGIMVYQFEGIDGSVHTTTFSPPLSKRRT